MLAPLQYIFKRIPPFLSEIYIQLIFKVDTKVDKILSLWGTRHLGKTPIRLLFCWISISILSSNVMSTTSDYKIAAVCELLN